MYRVAKGNLDFLKNMLLLKNPQFLPNQYETLSKKGTCECLILTKFCNGRVKIVDFLIKAYFWVSLKFGVTYCTYSTIPNNRVVTIIYLGIFSNNFIK